MNRVISWIQNILLRQILVVFLVAATFFVGQSFTYGTAMMAQANTVQTPEGTYYKGTPDSEGIRNDNQVRNAQNRLRNTADNVREKLNLDEDTPRATKEFGKSVQRKIGETVNQNTQNEGGYYQQPERVREARSRS
ncbi:hypothetical protein ACN23B_04470 [Anabaena sp. FACHB-709]|uniref:Uncharacterized protein n=2 Tax=Nostocaceae TaxID=1162 RepID=A0A1Z4KS91_ANAVA|nr:MULTISPECIES: hypothetical protein [Nostocaceae]BAY71866.1 hypothetical protein NIES23_46890 [Trichormus variabilis NIES-23]HBW33775.1 hypothetical protein [Nostoc sp. UBA8866]MBD2172227.1 hypothetical protein [Anabaena cylindrica FACHB-318]MBD2263952.1 hypothetical protein [Anabaena sp. FACHB-709]MBD2273168.1 hypothetical protein [Nostoc sp. PCC 7120 = FACHB-418]